MESISSTNIIPTITQHSNQGVAVSETNSTHHENISTQSNSSQLQPDTVELSEESKAKSAEAEKKEDTNKAMDGSRLNSVMTKEELDAANKADASELDEQIRELSMEILELSLKIEMLKAKEDNESMKERQALEVDLAIKKGQLEAAMDRKLQLAAL